ncbi:MAG: competence/damage-inducible protein A [Terriglobia bacterium]
MRKISNPKCETVSIGDELATGLCLDENGPHISSRLLRMGIECRRHTVIPDEIDAIVRTLENGEESDFLIMTGGLGSTADDITREAIAAWAGRKLETDPELAQAIKEHFGRLDVEMPDFALRQARIPKGARPLRPQKGSAPGIMLETKNTIVFALPGVPYEMQDMLEQQVMPQLKTFVDEEPVVSQTIKTCGLSETGIAEQIGHNLRSLEEAELAYLAYPGEVHLRLTARGSSSAEKMARLSSGRELLEDLLGDAVYGADEDTLEGVVGSLLRRYDLRVAIAESLTGGLIASRLTDVPGSSDYLWGGITAYSNEMKISLLGVPKETILQEGAVSQATALAMASGIRSATGVEIGLSVTGIAGPEGGTPEKPVGLVHMALATKEMSLSERFQFWGHRARIKEETVAAALNMLRLYLVCEFEKEGDAA